MLGISMQDINPAQHTGPDSEKPLAVITAEQLVLFNSDLNSIAAQYVAEPIRLALEKYQKLALTVARAVMYAAGQPYKGANALGDEICMRLILPVDVGAPSATGIVNEENWDQNLSAATIGDVWGYQRAGSAAADDTMGEEEGNIIVGWIDPVPLSGFCSYQVIKGGKTFGYYSISYTGCVADAIKFSPCIVPIPEWPEEALRINMVVARLINPEQTQAVGLHFARASAIRTAQGSA